MDNTHTHLPERQVDTQMPEDVFVVLPARVHQDSLGWAHVVGKPVFAQVNVPVSLEIHEGIVARGGADLVQQSGAHLREPQLWA